MVSHNKVIIRGRTYHALIVLTTMVLMTGCAGTKGFRMEFESGKNNDLQKMRELGADQASTPLPGQDLPEISGNEYEQLGDALLNKRNYYLAYVHYEKALKIEPGNNRIEYKKGLALLLGDKYDDAIDQFKSVIKKDPEFAKAYEGIGKAYFEKRDYPQAERYLRHAVKLDPTLWKSHTYIASIHEQRKDYTSAIASYQLALDSSPNKGMIYNNIGYAYLLKGDYHRAVFGLKKALAHRYTNEKVYNNLGMALANLEKYEEALQAFIKSGSEAQAFNNLGCILLDKGKLDKAIVCFEKAIELDPKFYAIAGENLTKARTLNHGSVLK
jgi:tetratricopeptide (TPR) repeat protein